MNFSDYVNKPNKQKLKKRMVNKIRTKLLIEADDEYNKHLKHCNVMINSKLPKEIMMNYINNFIITLENPFISSRKKGVVVSEQKVNIFRNNSNNSASSLNSFNKVLNAEKENDLQKNMGVLIFSKCINEIGKDFIDGRKKNLSYKKLAENKKLNVKVDTSSSLIETINNLRSSNIKSNKSSSNKNKNSGFFNFALNNSTQKLDKKNNDNFLEKLMDSEEKEAKNIQENFNKLQNLVSKLKITNYMNNDLNMYNNFTKFNEELFEILKIKNKKFNINKRYGSISNKSEEDQIRSNINENNSNDNNEVYCNPFNSNTIKINDLNKKDMKSNKSLPHELYDSLEKYNKLVEIEKSDSEKEENFEDEENDYILNDAYSKFNTLKYSRVNNLLSKNQKSVLKSKKLLENISSCKDIIDNTSDDFYSNYDYELNAFTYNSGNLKLFNNSLVANTPVSEKHITDIIKAQGRADSDISKQSESDYSKYTKSSILSKNYSIVTKSSGEIDFPQIDFEYNSNNNVI
jgi:hypothetical protein